MFGIQLLIMYFFNILLASFTKSVKIFMDQYKRDILNIHRSHTALWYKYSPEPDNQSMDILGGIWDKFYKNFHHMLATDCCIWPQDIFVLDNFVDKPDTFYISRLPNIVARDHCNWLNYRVLLDNHLVVHMSDTVDTPHG